MLKYKNSSNKDMALESLAKANSAYVDVILKIQTKKTYEVEGCAQLNFKNKCNVVRGDGTVVVDLTTDEQNLLGMSVLHVKVLRSTSTPIHKHKDQAQLVYIIKGKAKYIEKNIERVAGDSFLIDKGDAHTLTYDEGTEILLIFIPGLTTI